MRPGDLPHASQLSLRIDHKKVCLLLVGDWNAKLGAPENAAIVNFILGGRNDNVDGLAKMALALGFLVTGTTSKKNYRVLVIWLFYDHRTKNQINYILLKQRWRSSVLDVATTRQKTVLDLDHKMLLVKIRFKLKAYTSRWLPFSSQLYLTTTYRASLLSFLPTSLDDLNKETAWTSIRNAMSANVTRSLP